MNVCFQIYVGIILFIINIMAYKNFIIKFLFIPFVFPLFFLSELHAQTGESISDRMKRERKEVSYACGLAASSGFKKYVSQNMQVDTISGLEELFRGIESGDKATTGYHCTDYQAGVKLKPMIKSSFSQGNYNITNDSLLVVLDFGEYMKGFKDGVMYGEGNGMTIQEAGVKCGEGIRSLKAYPFMQNLQAGEDFLRENAHRQGVVVLPSGLQYKILRKGKGDMPLETSTVYVSYTGRTVEGHVFDKGTVSLRVNHTIEGFSEALTMMPLGSVWEVYIPHNLAYGTRSVDGYFDPYSTLIFKIELKKIVER